MKRPVAPSKHGTLTGYSYGCRCEACFGAAVDYRRARRNGEVSARGRGRPKTTSITPQICAGCGSSFTSRTLHTFCSKACWNSSRRFEDEPVPRKELLRRAGGLSQKALTNLGRRWKVEGRVCVYCDQPAETADHLVPLIRGGENTLDNLVPACLSCNSSKGSLLVEEWEVRRAS